MHLSGALHFSEIGKFKGALRITSLFEMKQVYCFHESPTNLFIMEVSPLDSDSTACQAKRGSGAAHAPELPLNELARKRNQRHLPAL